MCRMCVRVRVWVQPPQTLHSFPFCQTVPNRTSDSLSRLTLTRTWTHAHARLHTHQQQEQAEQKLLAE